MTWVIWGHLRLYHLRIGFQRVLLFFDAPDDPSELEAIEVAEGLSGAPS